MNLLAELTQGHWVDVCQRQQSSADSQGDL
jgi:hypothetical protein